MLSIIQQNRIYIASMRPSLERINRPFGSSIKVRQYADPSRDKAPVWHFHPEMELVYVNGGSGRRHIGNRISYFSKGDLLFIGSKLPHYGFTDRLTGNKSETVVQMTEDFLGEGFFEIPEMREIKTLIETSRQGISFHGKTKEKIGRQLEDLVKYDSFDQLLKLLSILKELAQTEEYEILNVQSTSLESSPQDHERISRIYDHVRNNFRHAIPLDQIASETGMTVPAFCRYFKRKSGKTFTQFVNEHRLVHASKLLSERSISINDVCFESGFNNFSHFNKQFKEFTGKNPSTYRNELKHLVR